MLQRIKRLVRRPRLLLDVFVIANLAFLTVDIYLAHLFNNFAHPAEWVPFYFSLTAPILLAGAVWAGTVHEADRLDRLIGLIVGAVSVGIGVAGLIFHLLDTFFVKQTLMNLVYTAPFVAPLSYSGLGLLLILNRSWVQNEHEWGRWVIILALCGFLGNFVLSVADHAQNGFFLWQEWIPVASSALGLGFLIAAVAFPATRGFQRLCIAVLALQVIVGLLGFYYHASAAFHGPMETLLDNIVYGPPIFAPLLLPNMVVPTAIGLWVLWGTQPG